MNDVTPQNASFFNLPDASGAIVAQVTPDSPASRGGVKQGDVIEQLNGQKIIDGSDLQVAVSEMRPGSALSLGVIRDGKMQTLKLTVGEFHANGEVAENDSPDAPQKGRIGVSVGDLTQDLRQQLQVPQQVTGGAVVQSVLPGSPAEDAGLQQGDIILEVNRKPAQNASQFVSAVRQARSGDILLLVFSHGNSSYRTVRPDQQNG